MFASFIPPSFQSLPEQSPSVTWEVKNRLYAARDDVTGRIVWYGRAREGDLGPYESLAFASRVMAAYIATQRDFAAAEDDEFEPTLAASGF